MDESLAEEVRRRANYTCEYCRMPQVFYPTIPFAGLRLESFPSCSCTPEPSINTQSWLIAKQILIFSP